MRARVIVRRSHGLRDALPARDGALDDERAFTAARMPVRELKFLAKLADDLDAMQSSLDD